VRLNGTTGRDRVDLAILIYDLRASGVAINALRIAQAARAAGLTVELWLLADEGPLRARMPEGVVMRPISAGGSALPRSLHSAMALPNLVGLIRSRKPALLLSSGNHVHAFASLAHMIAGVRGVRLIGRASNALAAVVPLKRQGILGGLARRASIMIEKWQYRRMDRIVSVSSELAEHLRIHAGAASGKLRIIPNGVDLNAIEVAAAEPVDHPWFANGAPPVIIAVGRLSRQKNFAQLIRAFALLHRFQDARLVIVGAGSSGEAKQLRDLATALGVADAVWLAGYQDNPYRFMARASMFVLSSRWEGASNVLIEALACGCPVVATDCPTGVREVIEDHAPAFLVPPDDVGGMAMAMQAALHRPHDRVAARRRAEDFSLSRSLAAYVTFLREWLPSDENRTSKHASDQPGYVS